MCQGPNSSVISDSTHFGSIEKSDEVIVELVGIVNPSYVELNGLILHHLVKIQGLAKLLHPLLPKG